MILNEALMKHNFITKVIFKDENKELSRDLKVKLIKMRIELGKIRKNFDEDLQEVIKEFTPEGYRELVLNNNRTEEENKQLFDWNNEINSAYNSYVKQKGTEEVSGVFELTEDELNEIIEVNSGNSVTINETKLTAEDFLEVLYTLFIKQ